VVCFTIQSFLTLLLFDAGQTVRKVDEFEIIDANFTLAHIHITDGLEADLSLVDLSPIWSQCIDKNKHDRYYSINFDGTETRDASDINPFKQNNLLMRY